MQNELPLFGSVSSPNVWSLEMTSHHADGGSSPMYGSSTTPNVVMSPQRHTNMPSPHLDGSASPSGSPESCAAPQSGDISNSSNDARSAGGVQQHNAAKKKSHNDQQKCLQCSGTVVDRETAVNAMARKKDDLAAVKTVIVKNKVEFEECEKCGKWRCTRWQKADSTKVGKLEWQGKESLKNSFLRKFGKDIFPKIDIVNIPS